MEEEKRRKKNRKKKSKPTKPDAAPAPAPAVDDIDGLNQNQHQHQHQRQHQHAVNNGKDEHTHLSDDTDDQTTITHPPNAQHSAFMQTAQGGGLNQQEIGREVSSEEIATKLKNDNDMLIQKEVISEATIRKLKEESGVLIQKEAMLEESINRLKTENDLLAKEQDNLKTTIAHLQSGNNSLLQIKVGLEEKTNQLSDENSVLGQKVESLMEKISHLERDISLSFDREKSTKETVSYLNDDVTRLQLQVAELEESRKILLLENQQLKENLSGLQAKIGNLEKSGSSLLNASAKDDASENEDLKSQVEAAQMLIKKLVAENAELVEKVKELSVEHDQRSAAVELSGNSGTDGLDESTKHNTVAIAELESEENITVAVRGLDSSGEAPAVNSSGPVNAGHVDGVISSSSLASEDSGEIVQIPLDDSVARRPELQAVQNVEKDEVPLTDAPIIGAPFRFISFVAKYVSGADLVHQSSPNTTR